MKICAISDLHGILPSVPECDVLCIAGDVVDLLVQRSSDESDAWWSTAFITWANKLSCEKIFVVPGNHDIYIEQLYNGLIKDITLQEFKDKISLLTNNKVVFLIDELHEYKGVTFYGTPWIAPIHWQTWAFEDTQHEYDEYVCPYENIPDCDILITHENPNYNEKLEHYCFGKYKHHFFGHWHNGISCGHLNQHNCSILTDSYMIRERLKIVTIVFDLEKKSDKSREDLLFNLLVETIKHKTEEENEEEQ